MTPRICLNMIVRNEAAIIERCLTALAPHIGCWAITDTGSTDDTIEIIQRVFAGIIPGVLTKHPFENFAQARNAALDAARGLEHPGWSLLLADADMELVVTDPNWRQHITGAHQLVQRSTHLTYRNTRVLPADSTARYVGVTHEYLDVGGTPPLLEGAHFVDHTDGSSRTDKYARDIALLLEAHAEDPTNTRTVFYLAQSYRDNGDHEKAMDTYAQRVRMGGWDQEVWYSRYQLGVLAERRQLTQAAIVHLYLSAYQTRPSRAEPLVALARYHREHHQHHLALLYAEQAARIPMPQDSLFVNHGDHTWRALDEYAIAAHWTGNKDQAAAACLKLLRSEHLPTNQRPRVITNLAHALERSRP